MPHTELSNSRTTNQKSLSHQKILSLRSDDKYNIEDFFVSNSNREAYESLRLKKIGVLPYENILLIEGARSSGKTFLAKVAERIRGGVFIHKIEDIDLEPALDPNLERRKIYLIDDADKLEEEELFHIFNKSINDGFDLIIFAQNDWDIKLKDLRSRINSIKKTRILEPDDEMIEVVMTKEFSLRSISVNPEVKNYLKNKLERNFDALIEQINSIDEFCLKNKKNLSIKSISEWYKRVL